MTLPLLDSRGDKMKDKTTKRRRRKRNKSQDEKRSRILDGILDKWVYVKQYVDQDVHYLFLKHRLPEKGSYSKIEQVLLSNNDLYDGLYLITDYDVDKVYNSREDRMMIELKPKKFDLHIGKYAEKIRNITETYDDLKDRLIKDKYLTEDEFLIYCQNSNIPEEIEEIYLELDEVDED